MMVLNYVFCDLFVRFDGHKNSLDDSKFWSNTKIIFSLNLLREEQKILCK